VLDLVFGHFGDGFWTYTNSDWKPRGTLNEPARKAATERAPPTTPSVAIEEKTERRRGDRDIQYVRKKRAFQESEGTETHGALPSVVA
jgi:hypothetical protein